MPPLPSTAPHPTAPDATPAPSIDIVVADSPGLLAQAAELIREYTAGLVIDLSFQQVDAELASLPGDYAPPAGTLLLATVDGQPAGCCALRALADADYPDACEMKRLYVRPAFRGLGLGRLLAQELMDRATQCGYSTMLLDTLDEMESARGLYAALGFEEIPPYYFNPIAGARYLKADLDAPSTRW